MLTCFNGWMKVASHREPLAGLQTLVLTLFDFLTRYEGYLRFMCVKVALCSFGEDFLILNFNIYNTDEVIT